QPGIARDIDIAIVILEHVYVREIIEDIAGVIVVDVQALFLNEGVWRAGVDVDARRESDRAEGTVWRERDIVGFSHAGDLLHFRDPTCMREIGLDDVDMAAFEDGLEVPPRVQPLTGGDGYGRLGG